MEVSASRSFIKTNPVRLPPSSYKPIIVSCRGANLYKVLSLESEKVGAEEIKKAYRAMALQYHPDVCPAARKEEFTRKFVEAHKAYKTLSDPILRKTYDYELGLGEDEEGDLGEETGRFRRETWMVQLSKLKMRSDEKMRARRRC